MTKSKTTVHRIPLNKGRYTTISRNVLMSKDLTDPAKTLLQICLNNSEDWKLVLSFYRKQLGWSNDKLSNAVKCLIENGFLKKDKHPKGNGKYFYTYTVSEYGNLNPYNEKVDLNKLKSELEELEEETTPQPEEQLQPTETNPTPQEGMVAQVTNEPNTEDWSDKVLGDLLIRVDDDFRPTNEFLQELLQSWDKKIINDKLTETTFDAENEYQEVKVTIDKNNRLALQKIISWIDFHNTKGTIAQKSSVREHILRHFQENKEICLELVTEMDVRNKILLTQFGIIPAKHAPDYMD